MSDSNTATPQVTHLPAVVPRVETGVVQHGDDWPGVFIRGDHAADFALALDALLYGDTIDPISVAKLCGLNELLKSSNTHPMRAQTCQKS